MSSIRIQSVLAYIFSSMWAIVIKEQNFILDKVEILESFIFIKGNPIHQRKRFFDLNEMIIN